MLVAEVLSGRVRAALAGGDVGAARALCRARLRDCGEEAVTLRCLAQVELAAGQLDAALEWGRRACALAPEEAMSWLALGHAQALSAQWSEAARSFSRATRRAPDSGDAWHNLGVARRHQGDSAAALAAFKQAVWVDAGRADSWLAMARLLQADSQADNALGCYRRAASRDPAALPEYADALRAHGQLEEAAGRYREALRRDIEPVRSGFGLGQVLEALGRRERAEGAYLQVLEREPQHPGALGALLALGGPVAAARHHQASEMLNAGAGGGAGQALIGYGLARYLDAQGLYGDAAAAARVANEGRRRQAGGLDRPALAARVAALEDYDRAFFASRSAHGEGLDGVVLIVGLPRTGTTLAEQILAAHPQVHGAGEIDALPRIAAQLAGPDVAALAAAAGRLDRRGSRAMAAAYRQALAARAPPAAARWIDKTPFNLFHLGLAALLLPQARVICCTRDPRDTALSIWLANFAESQRYATDLGDIAALHRAAQRVMVHWQHHLPLPWLTLRYEDMVSDPVAQTRRLLAFLELPWDPACLRFHESRRSVDTPSRWQVRQPVYAGAVGRWRRYLPWLPELAEVFDSPAARAGAGPDAPASLS